MGSVGLLLFFQETQRVMALTSILAAGSGKGCHTGEPGTATNQQSHAGFSDVYLL